MPEHCAGQLYWLSPSHPAEVGWISVDHQLQMCDNITFEQEVTYAASWNPSQNLWAPCYASNPAAFMDMPEAGPADNTPGMGKTIKRRLLEKIFGRQCID